MGVRQWFGPSREEIWLRLSEKVGGRYVDGGFWTGDKVEVTHKDWIVTVDVHVVPAGKAHIPMTRIRAPYVNPTGFRFTVYRKSALSGIAKVLGMQDIEIGDPLFDDDFIIKATDESQARALLASPQLRELLAQQKSVHLTVKDDEGWFAARFPEGVDELHFEVAGVITDIERLSQLYQLFAATLDQLTRIGAAYDGPAHVTL